MAKEVVKVIPIIVVFLSIVLIAGIVIYVRKLQKIVFYASERDLDLFGRKYQSLSALFADISFLNELFSGKKILMHTDTLLVTQLQKLRILLWILIIIGIANQTLVMFNAVK